MTSPILSGLRSVAAILAGFLVITLGTVLTFEVLLHGIGFHKSSATELAIATIGALAAGLAGGFVAARLAGRHPLRHAGALAIPISIDTAAIVVSNTSSDPLWFDLGGSATLLFGALVAGYLVDTKLRPRRTSPQPG